MSGRGWCLILASAKAEAFACCSMLISIEVRSAASSQLESDGRAHCEFDKDSRQFVALFREVALAPAVGGVARTRGGGSESIVHRPSTTPL